MSRSQQSSASERCRSAGQAPLPTPPVLTRARSSLVLHERSKAKYRCHLARRLSKARFAFTGQARTALRFARCRCLCRRWPTNAPPKSTNGNLPACSSTKPAKHRYQGASKVTQYPREVVCREHRQARSRLSRSSASTETRWQELPPGLFLCRYFRRVVVFETAAAYARPTSTPQERGRSDSPARVPSMRSSCSNQLERFEPEAHVAPKYGLHARTVSGYERDRVPGRSIRGRWLGHEHPPPNRATHT